MAFCMGASGAGYLAAVALRNAEALALAYRIGARGACDAVGSTPSRRPEHTGRGHMQHEGSTGGGFVRQWSPGPPSAMALSNVVAFSRWRSARERSERRGDQREDALLNKPEAGRQRTRGLRF
jgi:hypothetical protein